MNPQGLNGKGGMMMMNNDREEDDPVVMLSVKTLEPREVKCLAQDPRASM